MAEIFTDIQIVTDPRMPRNEITLCRRAPLRVEDAANGWRIVQPLTVLASIIVNKEK